jgi:hypothetical protein
MRRSRSRHEREWFFEGALKTVLNLGVDFTIGFRLSSKIGIRSRFEFEHRSHKITVSGGETRELHMGPVDIWCLLLLSVIASDRREGADNVLLGFEYVYFAHHRTKAFAPTPGR